MLKKSSFDFLTDLSMNNSREWMDQHREDYQDTLKNLNDFVQSLICAISKFDMSIAKSNLQSKDCIPKLNRDLRFTKDKSPYKTYLYAIINEGGRKSHKSGYFLFMNPHESYIGGGAYQPEAKQLKKIRQEIEYNYEKWKNITEDKRLLKSFPDGVSAQERLQRVPKGFDKDSPAEEFLKMKGFFVRNHHPDIFFRRKDSFDTIVESFKACQQLNNFINVV